MNDQQPNWQPTEGWQFDPPYVFSNQPVKAAAFFGCTLTAEQVAIAAAVINADALNGSRFDTWAEFVAANSDAAITHLYNSGKTTAQIAAQLDIPEWQVAGALARLRPSGVLTKRKRTTEAEARQLLTEAGADFGKLASVDCRWWQPEAARLLDAGIAPSQLARFTAVSKARVCAWAKRRAQQ